MRLWGLLLVWLVVATTQSHAAIQTLALTGASVPQIPGEEFSIGDSVFPLARLSNNGSVGFAAMLNQATASVDSSNDYVLIRFADDENHVIVREGSGGVPGVAGAHFAAFSNFGIDDVGTIMTRGTLVTGVGGITTANNQGFWKFTETTSSEVARTTSANAGGVPGVRFEVLGSSLRHSSAGHLAFDARLKTEGSASGTNDVGVWKYDQSGGSVVARESQLAPGPLSPFESFGAPAVNSNGDVAFRAIMKSGGLITLANRLGIWRYSNGTGQMIARIGNGNVPELPAAHFGSFSDPLINSSDQLAFTATLTSGESGLWRYTGTTGDMLAVTGSLVPDVPGTTFFEIKSPVLSDVGQVVASGTLNNGPGVDSSNNSGLWAFDNVKGNRLLVRTGIEGTVPGKPESVFESFHRWSTNAAGDILTLAELSENYDDLGHQGIWLYPYEGTPQLLLQSGDALAGRIIERLKILTDTDSQGSVTEVFNNSGQFVFQAEFTNGDYGLFLYSPEATTTYAEADFNTDGYVDSTDLTWWANAFGETAVGDADDDGDSDGHDFLIWQRQFTGPPVQTALAVPEPTVWWFLALIIGFAQHRSTLATVRCV